MCLRKVGRGEEPPGANTADEDLEIEGEPPGGLWEMEGLQGPGGPQQERFAKGCEPGSTAGEDQEEEDEQQEHFWQNDDQGDDEDPAAAMHEAQEQYEAEEGLHDCGWNPDQLPERVEDPVVPILECRRSPQSGDVENSRVIAYHVPQIKMIEATYAKKAIPKRLPFKTGLLSKMIARGGVRPPSHQPPVPGWVEQLLAPICG